MANPLEQRFLSETTWSAIACSLRLSPTETEIVKALFVDDSEKTIAETIGRSPHTVHTHMERLYLKLAVRSHSQLVVRIFREYLTLMKTVNSQQPVDAPPAQVTANKPTCARGDDRV